MAAETEADLTRLGIDARGVDPVGPMMRFAFSRYVLVVILPL